MPCVSSFYKKRAQRQVLWVTLPNEHHYPGSVEYRHGSFVSPVFRATLWLSSGAQRFPAAFQSKRIG